MYIQSVFLKFTCTELYHKQLFYPEKMDSEAIFLDVLLTREIPLGSPPHSSSTTIRFADGFSHERGTWYLKTKY